MVPILVGRGSRTTSRLPRRKLTFDQSSNVFTRTRLPSRAQLVTGTQNILRPVEVATK
jgi:hypothetical protein